MARRATGKEASLSGHSGEFISVFPTEIGWLGIVGRNNVVRSVYVGHPSASSVHRAARPDHPDGGLIESDWHPELRAALTDYASGKSVDFTPFDVELPPRTPFRDKVLAATRRIGYGKTTTYGELARQVGHPGAARAVGTVMSSNRFPILIPCHRVLAAGGRLGGYTSPAGTGLKQRLLEMECPASCFN